MVYVIGIDVCQRLTSSSRLWSPDRHWLNLSLVLKAQRLAWLGPVSSPWSTRSAAVAHSPPPRSITLKHQESPQSKHSPLRPCLALASHITSLMQHPTSHTRTPYPPRLAYLHSASNFTSRHALFPHTPCISSRSIELHLTTHAFPTPYPCRASIQHEVIKRNLK